MKKLYNFLFVLVITTLLASGCKKEGPQGPPGNANIIHHTFSISSWSNNGYNWYSNLNVSELNSSNINTASVQVYFSVSNGTWVAVPYTEVTSPSNYFMNFLSSAGTVEITWTYNGVGLGSDPNAYYSATVQAKVVVIPPSARMKHPNVDLNNYEEVKKAFGIID
ncbi:MAG TPA: hypothetical protein VI112_16080 [Bacteroidia bacterium]|jgi:hypothetical protein